MPTLDCTTPLGVGGARSGQLLVMSVTAASVAPGGDYVGFDTVLDMHGFDGVLPSSGGQWVHPITATYVLTYEHAWDSFQGGGDVDLELDGVTSLARRIGTRTDWQRGRGTIHYYAEAGQVGRIKVAHSDGSAQTCSAAMWLSVSDPLGTVAGHTAELYVGDELVAWTDETLTATHNGAATVAIGETSSTATAASFTYDDVSLLVGGVEQLGNGGFESALAGVVGYLGSRVVTTGNWRVYDQGDSSHALVASPVHSGSSALQVTTVAGEPDGIFAYQDATVAAGSAFEISVWVYPTSGSQDLHVLFDWDRENASEQVLSIDWTDSNLSVVVFGVSLPAAAALPTGQWSQVRLVVAAQEVA